MLYNEEISHSTYRKDGVPLVQKYRKFVFSLCAFFLLAVLILGWRYFRDSVGGQKGATRFVAPYVLPVAFSSDGQTLAAGQGQVQAQLWLWSLQSGRLQQTIETGHNAAVWTTIFSPDNKTVVTTGRDDERIYFWDVQTGQKVQQLVGKQSLANSLFFASDSHLLVKAGLSFDSRPTIEIWDVKAKKLINTQTEGRSGSAFAAPMPDGQTFLTTGNNGITIRDLPSGDVRRVVQSDGGGKICLHAALSTDGAKLAKGVRSVAGGPEEIEIWNVTTGALVGIWPENSGSGKTTWKSSLAALAFSPDGKLLASSSIFGKPRIQLRNAQSGKVLHILPIEAQSLAFSPDGKLLAIATQGEVQLHKVDDLLERNNS